MALTVFLPPFYLDGTPETYILRNGDTNACSGPSDISFRSLKRISGSDFYRIDVYRGELILSSDEPPLDVVCKIGFGRKARDRVSHEASMYTGKLSHLQGECIPHCHGYFEGDTDEGPTGCIVLAYCGEPIKEMLGYLPDKFKIGIIHALVGIHDAGLNHLDLTAGNILDYNGRPMIIDFEDSEDHECGRHIDIEIGAPGPSAIMEIGCPELYQFFLDLKIWTPAFIRYIDNYWPIKFAFDARTLAMTAPSHWSQEEALKEANRVIVEHVKTYYPAEYDHWRASFNTTPMITDWAFTSPSDTPKPHSIDLVSVM